MAYELVNVLGTGTFSGTVFGNKSEVLPDQVDLYSNGALSDKLFQSNVGTSQTSNIPVDIVRPTGRKNVLADPSVLKQAASSGKSPEAVVQSALKDAPKGVSSFGNIFDDGSMSFDDVTKTMGRLKDAVPSSVYNNMDLNVFLNAVTMANELSKENKGDGYSPCDVNMKKKLASATNNTEQGIDIFASAGALIGYAIGMVEDCLNSDVAEIITKLSGTLGITDTDVLEQVKKKVAIGVSSKGSFTQTKNLVYDIGKDKFNTTERAGIVNNVSKTYRKPDGLPSSEYATESVAIKNFNRDLKPDWGKKKLGEKEGVVMLNELGQMSEDLKEVMAADDEVGMHIAMTKFSFV